MVDNKLKNETTNKETIQTEINNVIKSLSPFALSSTSAVINLTKTTDGTPISTPEMRVDIEKSRIRTIWQEETERDIMLVGYDLGAATALESYGASIEAITPVTVLLPLDVNDGELRSLVKKQELGNIGFISFQAIPAIQCSVTFSSLTISFSADGINILKERKEGCLAMDKYEILVAFFEKNSDDIEKLPDYLEEAYPNNSHSPKELYIIDVLEEYAEALDLALEEVVRKLSA
ncbi:hypothetical protein BFC22_11655 [Carnobacterium divergens]|uniref:hypothetical protein n=1 Tax=Carnobacterium divergens TaxID=2748 RepID=UPI000E767214|nr:hypothetical protein [Carnobacterium divergens]AOA00700.1 hypothetical protein BFC22_11655 [Carnobacterium divergens]